MNDEVKTKFCEKDYDNGTGLAYFQFGNGTKLEINVNELSDEIRQELMFHGLMQKVGDSYAGAKANYAEGIASAQKVIDQLIAGEWAAKRAAGEGKPRVGELAEAIARVKGVAIEKAAAAVAKATKEQVAQWRKLGKVKEAILAIRMEKLARSKPAADEGEINLD
jgi:hypothetical protein